jgi:hypothetical protein
LIRRSRTRRRRIERLVRLMIEVIADRVEPLDNVAVDDVR